MTDDTVHDAPGHGGAGPDAPGGTDAGETGDGPGAGAQYGVGPFTVREIAILGAWAVAFVFSFFSYLDRPFESIWMTGVDWILTIGVPTVAVFLLVLRRFSPDGIRRVGSLGIDQFASVAFSVAALLWLSYIWNTVTTVAEGGPWYTSWVVWVEFFAMLALVLLTVFAPFIPPFHEDFRGREPAPAHRNARAVRRVIARPRPEPVLADEPDPYDGDSAADDKDSAAYDSAPGAYAPGATAAYAPGASAAHRNGVAESADQTDTGVQPDLTDAAQWSPESSHAPGGYDAGAPARQESTAVEAPPVVSHQPFWALVPVERDVVDERTGQPLFRIGPTAWALVVVDRGSSFLVRHEDGRVGVLYDVSGVTRG